MNALVHKRPKLSINILRLCFCLLTLSFARGASASRVYGYVRSGSDGLAGATIRFYTQDTNLRYAVSTDGAGLFRCDNISAGSYSVLASAAGYASEWYKNANRRELARSFVVLENSITNGCDFNLPLGQSPALASVKSLPSNAVVYVDFHPVTNLTSAVIALGEAALRTAQDPGNEQWFYKASHIITARREGSPWPPPQRLPGLDADVCQEYFSLSLCEDYYVAGLCDDFRVEGICSDYFIAGLNGNRFDFGSTNIGGLTVSSTPQGSEVFIDSADTSVGTTPVVATNLLQGWHTIQLRNSGYLQPRPIRIFVVQGTITDLTVPLHAPAPGVTNLTAIVSSTPSGAMVYVDYLLTTSRTPAVITGLDHAAVEGERCYSVSHSISLRKDGYLNTFPWYVRSVYPGPSLLNFSLVQSPAAMGDLVWFDANTNGVQDPFEHGVSNVTVNLYDAKTNFLQTSVTDRNGNYCFKSLTAGTYLVEVYPPFRFAFTGLRQGTNGAVDSDVWPATGRTDPTPVTWGEYDLQEDAGLKTNAASAFWFRAMALTNNVYLRWMPPAQSGMLNSNVLIRYSPDSFPASTTDGLSLFTGTDTMYQQTGLTPSQTYYYTIWVTHNGVRWIVPP
ncbi:MAG: SdrD B-like domain-containing protein [Lentisphaerota bacterium]